MPADAVREAGIVPDHRAVTRLAAGNGLLKHHGLQALGGCVDRGRQPGRPDSDDNDITLCDIAEDGSAGRLDDLSRRRPYHRVAVVADQDRQP